MKGLRSHLVVIIWSILISNLAISQTDDNTEKSQVVKDSSYVALSTYFISDAVFMGRKDSIAIPYAYASVMYHHKSGFYATGALSYLTKSEESRVDLFLVSAGFDFTTKKLDGDLSITKYFFNEDSYNVISEVEADVTAQVIYDFSILNLGASAGLYFNSGSSSDLFLSSEISHDFITRNQKFQMSPTAGIYFGSQNFYEQYYINNRFGNGRGQQGQQRGQVNRIASQSSDINLKESETFGLMAIEFSLPMWLVYHPWVLLVSPYYALPQNPAIIIIDDTVYKEDLKDSFYWIAGVTYKF